MTNAPEGQRVAVIRLVLSEEQRTYVRQVTGADVSEALVAGLVNGDERLENEIDGPEAEAIALKIWDGNQRFIDNMKLAPKTEGAFVRRIGHELERTVPNFAILR
jgi:hypothetical protein